MSTVRSNTYQDATGGSNAVFSGVASPPNGMGFRNRIINGDMRIDQRNAGASVTVNSTTTQFPVDRFQGRGEADGVFTLQQSSAAPEGFVNSLVATVTTADASIGASQLYFLRQNIEGYNVADFNFGTANAKTFTLSFWVRSSVTGAFSGGIQNGSNARSYPFTYTISTANTWEYKAITISGDTTGTWLTTNGNGMRVDWCLGAGSTFLATANTWASGEYYGATGATNIIATSGATFYITGVQLEAGTVASPFERRDYGRELMMCQRYAASVLVSSFRGYNVSGGNSLSVIVRNPQTMRASPTVSITVQPSGTSNITGSLSIADTTPDNTAVVFTGSAAGQSYFSNCTFLATAEL